MPDSALPIYSSIVSDMAEGVIYLDKDDVIGVCNPAAEKIRNVKAAKIIGRSILTLHPPAVHHRIRELLNSLKSGTISSSNRVIRARSRYFDNSYSAIRDKDGSYVGTLLVSRDVTEQKRLFAENQNLRKTLTNHESCSVVAQSEGMRKAMEMAEAVARLDSTVLVTGDNGTGKECLVDFIHQCSARSEAPLVRVNCAALPENLIEAELFGHTRGAFTGAVDARRGKFELAHGGTIFLDEIGELPLTSQSKLLRVLQEKSFQPVGATREVRVNVRIIAATNRDLAVDVSEGRFREDLYYRLNVIHVDIPPLRERREDILPLAEMFMAHFAEKMNRSPFQLSPQVQHILLTHPLPGNVRQLKHAMERAVALGKGGIILPDDLPVELSRHREAPPVGTLNTDLPLKEAVAYFEKDYIGQTLRMNSGRKGDTAKALGISRKSLWEKMQRYDLE